MKPALTGCCAENPLRTSLRDCHPMGSNRSCIVWEGVRLPESHGESSGMGCPWFWLASDEWDLSSPSVGARLWSDG